MEREEYIKRAKQLGHTQEAIEDTLKEADEWESTFNKPYDFEMQLIELPISD